MSILEAVFATAIICTSCASPRVVSPVQARLPLVQGDGYAGVIFPADRANELLTEYSTHVYDYWTPSPNDIQILESRLQVFIQRVSEDPSLLRPNSSDRIAKMVSKIAPRLRQYRRQYAGIVVDGRSLVFINLFLGGSIRYAKWSHGAFAVDDGCYGYWRIQYDTASASFSDLRVNGCV